MKKTILLMLSLVFLGCSSWLSLSRISNTDLSQCGLKEVIVNYNSTGMILQYYNCDGSNIATLTERAGAWSKSENIIKGIGYKKYPSFILDGYNFDEDISERIWKTDEETGEVLYESEINKE
tara:strand:+ start:64 stop:429 length:366 start_codon:yes stop_codon:yes gene_type:complete